jgi:hypothetical protein
MRRHPFEDPRLVLAGACWYSHFMLKQPKKGPGRIAAGVILFLLLVAIVVVILFRLGPCPPPSKPIPAAAPADPSPAVEVVTPHDDSPPKV